MADDTTEFTAFTGASPVPRLEGVDPALVAALMSLPPPSMTSLSQLPDLPDDDGPRKRSKATEGLGTVTRSLPPKKRKQTPAFGDTESSDESTPSIERESEGLLGGVDPLEKPSHKKKDKSKNKNKTEKEKGRSKSLKGKEPVDDDEAEGRGEEKKRGRIVGAGVDPSPNKWDGSGSEPPDHGARGTSAQDDSESSGEGFRLALGGGWSGDDDGEADGEEGGRLHRSSDVEERASWRLRRRRIEAYLQREHRSRDVGAAMPLLPFGAMFAGLGLTVGTLSYSINEFSDTSSFMDFSWRGLGMALGTTIAVLSLRLSRGHNLLVAFSIALLVAHFMVLPHLELEAFRAGAFMALGLGFALCDGLVTTLAIWKWHEEVPWTITTMNVCFAAGGAAGPLILQTFEQVGGDGTAHFTLGLFIAPLLVACLFLTSSDDRSDVVGVTLFKVPIQDMSVWVLPHLVSSPLKADLAVANVLLACGHGLEVLLSSYLGGFVFELSWLAVALYWGTALLARLLLPILRLRPIRVTVLLLMCLVVSTVGSLLSLRVGLGIRVVAVVAIGVGTGLLLPLTAEFVTSSGLAYDPAMRTAMSLMSLVGGALLPTVYGAAFSPDSQLGLPLVSAAVTAVCVLAVSLLEVCPRNSFQARSSQRGEREAWRPTVGPTNYTDFEEELTRSPSHPNPTLSLRT